MRKTTASRQSAGCLLAKRVLGAALVTALSASACGVFAATALANTESDITDRWVESAQRSVTDKSNDAFSYAKSGSKTLQSANDSGLPSKYDLRDPNGDGDRSDSVVTPVKQQSPWSTCWSFASIAAAETSVLSKAGTTYAATGLDLSELQLADATYKAAPEKCVGKAQAGEGYRNSLADVNYGLDLGGNFAYATTMFAAGIGPLLESTVPYKNAEGIIRCKVTLPGSDEAVKRFLTVDQVKELENTGATVKMLYWAGNYTDTDTGAKKYTDWSVDDELWNQSIFELEDGNNLPETRVLDEDTGEYVSTDMEAVDTIKKELTEGRAVSIIFCADTSKPEQKESAEYIDLDNWAHYTYKTGDADHAVTIVGYDDDYSADNFSNPAGKKPEGNGAWLVKNNWGSETEDFPNNSSWGIVENGKHTGYFWLSYYDQSIANPESFDFDLTTYNDNSEYYIDQYDYLPENFSVVNDYETPTSSANVFTAEYDVSIRALSTKVCKPNTTVTYQVYLLDDKAKTPTETGHSTLVATFEDTYQYGGYHRTSLDASEWIALRKGQRYAVVVTQKCNDDGKYYQTAAVNVAEPNDEVVAAKEKSLRKSITADYLKDLSDENRDELVKGYIASGVTQEEAEQAADKKLQEMLAEKKEDIEADVSEELEIFKNTYYVARVNVGESFTGESKTVKVGEDTTWVDWTVPKAEMEIEYAASDESLVIDNLPIKAYAELNDWASVKELDALSSALKGAKALLKGSEAGMTQSQRSRLQAAVKDAKALLERAGSYKESLANTTPASDEVVAATEALKPAKVRGVKATGEKGALKVSWKKGARTGVQITYSAKKGMKGAKTVTVKGAKAASKAIKGLKGGKTYYVKLRAYVAVDGKKCYGAWSAKKSAKVK